jgi:hypothetical protein
VTKFKVYDVLTVRQSFVLTLFLNGQVCFGEWKSNYTSRHGKTPEFNAGQSQAGIAAAMTRVLDAALAQIEQPKDPSIFITDRSLRA